jgi:heptosyltransferase-1
MKVLLIRMSSIGDVVHTLPAAQALHAAGHEVSWLVEPASRTLLDGHPALARVFVAPPARRFSLRAALALVEDLQRERFDVALDLQGLFKSVMWARLSAARWSAGAGFRARREKLSSLFLHVRAAVPPEAVHVIDRNLAVLRAIGVDAVGSRAFTLPRPAHGALPEALAPVVARDFALLNPGGGWPSKLWPAEAWGALAVEMQARGLTPLVVWGPGEEALAARVAGSSQGAAVVAPATTLLELAELARRAAVVVAADTGPLHIACAVGAPVVALFGPTDPARNGPFAAADVVVRHAPPCAPCHRRGCAVHEGIMKTIEVPEVAQAVDARLGRGAAAPASA